jgi:segregation and condensation protein B
LILYPQELKSLLEALLLCSAEPLTLSALAEITGYESQDILETLDQLQQEYHAHGRGFEICEIAGGWMFATLSKHAPYIEKLVKPRLSTLSQASLEVLSIIAYRQPVTSGEMEDIRGVSCDSSVNTLLERGLIQEAGRKDVPGRPILFATTTGFLKYFGLTSLQDLPELDTGDDDDESDGKAGEQQSTDAHADVFE